MSDDVVRVVLAETWELSRFSKTAISRADPDDAEERVPVGDMATGGPERARIAACAPEALRLLLDMHENHGDRTTFDWAYWFAEIEKVLDKAGVPYPEPTP